MARIRLGNNLISGVGAVNSIASDIAYDNSSSLLVGTDVQTALDNLKSITDGLSAGGSDGVVTNVVLNGTDLDFTGSGGGFNGSVALASLQGASQLSDLSDVGTSTPTNLNVLAADGTDFDSTALTAAHIQSGTFADARISQSSVTQHESALTITESQISDLQTYALDADVAKLNTDNISNGADYSVAGIGAALEVNTVSGNFRIRGGSSGADMGIVVSGANILFQATGLTQYSMDNGGVISLGTDVINKTYGDSNYLQNDEDVPAAASATNYTPTGSTVEGHLVGIDTALGSIGGGASQLSDLSDVGTTTPTNLNVLAADGTDFDSVALTTAYIQSGTFADARISESSVTQHQSALNITESQISDLQSYVTVNGNQTVNDTKTFSGAILMDRGTDTTASNISLRQGTDTDLRGGTGYGGIYMAQDNIFKIYGDKVGSTSTGTELGIDFDALTNPKTLVFADSDITWGGVSLLAGGGSALEVEDEGVSLSTAVTKINFVGTAVQATEPVADEITVTINDTGLSTDNQNRILNENKTIIVQKTADETLTTEAIEISSGADIGKKPYIQPNSAATTRIMTLGNIGVDGEDTIVFRGNSLVTDAVLQVNPDTGISFLNLGGNNNAFSVENGEMAVASKLSSTQWRVDGDFTPIELDTTAPQVQSATVENSDTDALVVVFDEAVNVTNVTGLSLDGDWTGITIDSITSGSGTNTVTFALSGAIANGETGNFVYSGSNTISDLSSNALASGSTSVTNNVAGATNLYTENDAAQPGGGETNTVGSGWTDQFFAVVSSGTSNVTDGSYSINMAHTASGGFGFQRVDYDNSTEAAGTYTFTCDYTHVSGLTPRIEIREASFGSILETVNLTQGGSGSVNQSFTSTGTGFTIAFYASYNDDTTNGNLDVDNITITA